MIAKAISKYNRISPKKVRLLTRPLKGLTVAEAYVFLRNINKKASRLIYQLLKSAFDNARQKDSDIKETDLYISKLVADSGPMLKRYRAASMGRAAMIRKRTSHLAVHLDRKELPGKETKETKKTAKKRSIFRGKTESSKAKNRKVTASKKKR